MTRRYRTAFGRTPEDARALWAPRQPVGCALATYRASVPGGTAWLALYPRHDGPRWSAYLTLRGEHVDALDLAESFDHAAEAVELFVGAAVLRDLKSKCNGGKGARRATPRRPAGAGAVAIHSPRRGHRTSSSVRGTPSGPSEITPMYPSSQTIR